MSHRGRPSILAPNRLERKFTVDTSDQPWVTALLYLCTWQGGLYLTAVTDQYSRKMVGWSMRTTVALAGATDVAHVHGH
jgi:putative transposase